MAAHASRFVIVGAGLAGAATAWHLRRRGVADVVVLEKETVPGVHASGRNAAMLREAMDLPALQDLASLSASHLRSEALAPFRRTGGLLLGLGDAQVADHVPGLRGRARWCPEDGIVDVAGLLQAYLRGLDVRYGCRLESFRVEADRVVVETSRGRLEGDVLVNAAGAWAGTLCDLPLEPLQRTLYVTAADPQIDPDAPYVWDVYGGYYLRPESGGWLLCACDERVSAPGVYEDEPDVLRVLLEKLARHQPGLGEPRIVNHWIGQRTFAHDRLPVIGFDPRATRVFHVAALGGHGVTLSWAVGALAADALIAGRDTQRTLAPARVLGASATSPRPRSSPAGA